MQTSSVDQHREISKDDLLRIAPFSKRQLTKIYRAGYLPRPQRRSCPGSKKPVYYWDASIVEQARTLYCLLQWDRSLEGAALLLWLRGYAVEFAPLRQQWLEFTDIDLQMQAMQDEEDEPGDEPEDHISRAIVRMKDKWKHTPIRYRPEAFQQPGLEGLEIYALWAEFFFNGLLVTDYELADTTFATRLAQDFLPWLQMLQEILAFPRLRKVIEQATPEAWEQARLDYTTLRQFLHALNSTSERDDPPVEGFFLWIFTVGGFHLVPVALAIRQQGYGHWIDTAFAWVNEQFADPEVQANLAWAADPAVRARLTGPEGPALIMEHFAQRRAKSPG